MKEQRIRWRARREKEYKEDSVRGSSLVIPRTYKRDALVQVWMDSRKLAMLYAWLVKIGVRPRFVSEIVNESVDIVTDNLVRQGMVNEVETTTDARNILSVFQVDFNPSGRGSKSLHHNLVLDDRKTGKGPTVTYGERQRGVDPEMVRYIEEQTALEEKCIKEGTGYRDAQGNFRLVQREGEPKDLEQERARKDAEQLEAIKSMDCRPNDLVK